MNKTLTHLDEQGRAHMVDVGAKPVTARVAVAEAWITVAPATLDLLRQAALPKGDALACARVGAIMAAKRTPELIPLCHPVPLTQVTVDFELGDKADPRVRIVVEAHCTGQTGVEMEAIVAAQTGAAIIYDMCKAVQRDMVIGPVRLLRKSGGTRGDFTAPGYLAAAPRKEEKDRP